MIKEDQVIEYWLSRNMNEKKHTKQSSIVAGQKNLANINLSQPC